jgi:non-ribosomal peptide synthetase-like protein
MLICSNADNTPRWRQGERLEHLFEQTCDRVAADHAAVVTEDVTFTFRELDDRANQAARFLLRSGFEPGQRIALLLDKSIHAYVGLLATLKIGAAYVPLDASFPADRVDFILRDAGVAGIVSVSRFREKLAGFSLPQIFLDTAEREIAAQATARLGAEEKGASGDQLFYVIYTSGTTGKPKGVAIEHSGICNFVRVAGEVYGIREDDRCYQGITLAFDFHVEDLWVPLVAGATLIAGRSGACLFGNDLHAFLLQQKVTVLPCVPTLWATLEADLPDLRIVLLSGESVPHHLVVRWHRPGRSILNAYGPTECSVSSSLRRLLPENPVTIGTPLPTYTVVILEQDKNAVVADGAIGEIGIAGICLASGYLNRPDLTAQKFIPDFLDLPNNPSRRIYRTGDLGRIREDGELEFHGRIDTQVKIRGYRIELGEIEAVLMEVPQIAHAVVQPCEVQPGAVELVAYYTRRQGAPAVCPTEVSGLLRNRLPPYMVPAYLEELAFMPMTANSKADRKSLPPPKGQRLSASTNDFVAPRTATEQALAVALMEVMKLDRVSVRDHFFQALGAHSLLMARYSAEIRRRLGIASMSIRDIYLNPTLEQLAVYVDSLRAEAPAEQRPAPHREPVHVPPDFAYYGCGALQLLWYIGWSGFGLWVLVCLIHWTYGAMPDVALAYFRIVAAAAAVVGFSTALPVAAKWLLIGRWQQDAIPIWSLEYFRFWAVRTLIRSSVATRFAGPLYNLYLRLLGGRVGANAVIESAIVPVCTDLISIGPDTIVRKDSILLGYRAQSNYIHTGPIQIGAGAFVGEASVLDVNTSIGDGAQLGNSSALLEGQRVPPGKRYHGSPAQETSSNYCRIDAKACTPLRRWTYATVVLLAALVFIPVPVLIFYALFPALLQFLGGAQFAQELPAAATAALMLRMLLASFASFFCAVSLGAAGIGLIPRLLNLPLQKDRTYVLYGFHYFLQRTITLLSNSAFYNRLFGDSCGIVHYMRWIGYNLNRIVQTGSNFGEDQRHDNPLLCDIGSGTMVSDGFMAANTTMSNSAFRLGTVKIGANNYLGNYVRYPAEGKTGANCLLGTMVLVPVDGPVRENTGLLGSPAFEIPRAVSRDLKMTKTLDEDIRRQRLREKNRYNFVTAVLFLLKTWFLFFALSTSALLTVLYYPRYGMVAVFSWATFAFVFTVVWAWFVERASLGFGWLEPRIALVLDRYYWFHERHWHLFGLTQVAAWFAGTPFKNLISRLEGVRLGRKVFDDGVRWTEYSLIEIGDYANLNQLSIVWPHSLEEGVFKSDRIEIGSGCSLGSGSLVHYGVKMAEHAVLDPGSYLMKGEILDAHSRWQGNPARAVTSAAGPANRPANREAGFVVAAAA